MTDYEACSGGKGRVGTLLKLEQLVQPSVVPPPPISWYIKGITTRTVETLIHDLIAESTRLREEGIDKSVQDLEAGDNELGGAARCEPDDAKKRWQHRQGRHTRKMP